MDSVMMRQFSPTSSMFQTSATQNFANVGASSVRNQKDVAPQQEEDQNGDAGNIILLKNKNNTERYQHHTRPEDRKNIGDCGDQRKQQRKLDAGKVKDKRRFHKGDQI